MVAWLQLPSGVTTLLPTTSVAMPQLEAALRHGHRPCWRHVLRLVPVRRASCLLYIVAIVSPGAIKRPSLGSMCKVGAVV